MKKVLLLTSIVGSLFTTTLHAKEEIDYSDYAWYGSNELMLVQIYKHSYKKKCLSSDKVTTECTTLGQEIADQFNNSLLDERTVEYLFSTQDMDHEKYHSFKQDSLDSLKMDISEFAVKGKVAYIDGLLKKGQIAKSNKKEVLDFKRDFNQSKVLHKKYRDVICTMNNSYFITGSGTDNAFMYCIRDHNLEYLSELGNTAHNLEFLEEVQYFAE
ncbi:MULTISPECIES: hypothetical protein [unclassified Acinetobacter]|uniref:hypothetical protein n=1 Tax=unclassified Acinetobacter TaxID=196816 RepID=UPI0015D26552|nr:MULTISPECIES: hypothetical protein [unclassified Acinetobacter]